MRDSFDSMFFFLLVFVIGILFSLGIYIDYEVKERRDREYKEMELRLDSCLEDNNKTRRE